MSEFSSDILFEKFFDYMELYFRSREELINKMNKAKLNINELSEEQLDYQFGDEQDSVNQYRDLARKALDSYIKLSFI